ncbi:MAG: hypothetical protein ACREUO_08880, partial [Burkholderiales bacterium]
MARLGSTGTLLLSAAAALLAACASPYPPAEPPVATVPVPQLSGGETWVYDEINPYNRLRTRTVTDTLHATHAGFALVRTSDREGDPGQTMA